MIKSTPQDLRVRLEMDPADAVHATDWFSLRSKDGSFEQRNRYFAQPAKLQ